jgi:nitrate/nitrite transporter NarK
MGFQWISVEFNFKLQRRTWQFPAFYLSVFGKFVGTKWVELGTIRA